MLNKKALAASLSAVEQNLYVEDVFSTYLYTGNGSTQTITNGIDLSGEGGLAWGKRRNNIDVHTLVDTVRGAGANILSSNSTDASNAYGQTWVQSFSSTGFTVGGDYNANGAPYTTWTFRKAEKFFDVVTYTGTGSVQNIAHNLGSVPGCIIVKAYSGTNAQFYSWTVYHRSLTSNSYYLRLNENSGETSGANIWNSTTPTSTQFTVGSDSEVNASGRSYVAYLFAHDAGGFGDDGSQNVISCGTFTSDGSENATVSLGYEPQWVLTKTAESSGNWEMFDNMRGMGVSTSLSDDFYVRANLTSAETSSNLIAPTATGFNVSNRGISTKYIYIAIRRGPMKTPEAGTEVFNPVVYTGTNADNRLINTSLFTDMVMIKERNDTVDGMVTGDRLRGNPYVLTGTTAIQVNDANSLMTPTSGYGNAFAAMNGVGVGNDATSKVNVDTTSNNQVAWAFKRAPGFFDVVAYTGTGSNRTITHNLGVVPELMLVKRFTTAADWAVYASPIGNTKRLFLNLTDAETTQSTVWNNTTPTSSVFSVGTEGDVNSSGDSFVAYLFASLAGVSKVGSYTGNGTSVTVTTDFQPRFILVKRYDSTGNWVVGDSARGLVAGNDPFIQLDVNAGEITNEDWVDVTSTSFTINETTENLCVNNGTYIYLAIA